MADEYTRERALEMLGATDGALEELYRHADAVRKNHMGDDVYIRGIIEFSNICVNDCLYCGIRASNRNVARYVMSPDEILAIAGTMGRFRQTTVVLQSGETPGIADEKLGVLIRRIKDATGLAVTVSVGNRPLETYRYWRECGMDRYLLRFETSDAALFARLHPGSSLGDRLRCLEDLKGLGVQTGSGFMIGLPGETVGVLADNILLCRRLDLDIAAEALLQRGLDRLQLGGGQRDSGGHLGLHHALRLEAQLIEHAGDFRQQRQAAVLEQQAQEVAEHRVGTFRRQQRRG
ncbi:MAG TPA: radical SAM protein, partial [Syntrophorhabdaceae bacterium]|nr:radical SAM protein [Syntrophorhabdaceae bacterium]